MAIKYVYQKLLIGIIVIVALAGCGNTSGSSTNSGTLSFQRSNIAITQNSSTELTVTLSNSRAANGAMVTIFSSNPQVAVVEKNTCILSDESGFSSSCEIGIKGLASGVATISATAPGVTTAMATAQVGTSIVQGQLRFSYANESVIVGGLQRTRLYLDNSSGVSDLEVDLQNAAPSKATITPSKCVLSTTIRSCDITIKGVATGQTLITASASGYSSVNNSINVISNQVIKGILKFDSYTNQVYVGSYIIATLSLVGSSGVTALPVTLSRQNANAAISPTACNLSTSKPICYVVVSGISDGNNRIVATANGYSTAGMLVNIVTKPVAGSFYFSKVAESVSVDGTTKVELIYSGGSGISYLPVSLITNNGNATISPHTCNMSNISGMSKCTITVSANAIGTTIIKASASGYADATNTVNIIAKNNIVYGNLAFRLSSVTVGVNKIVAVTLELLGSSNVSNLPVVIKPSDINTVTVTPSCTLSTANNTCTVTIKGLSIGSTVVSASANNISNIAKIVANVSGDLKSYLAFTPEFIVLANTTTSAQTATLSLINPSSDVQYITLTSENTSLANLSPGFCNLSASNPSCVVNVNNSKIGNIGATKVLAVAADSSIPPGELPLTIATPEPVSRTITLINDCNFPVYFGVSGGSVYGADSGNCPSGSTASSGSCYWNNPSPVNGSYLLESNGGQNYITIPSTSLTNVAGRSDVWSGGIMARLNCDQFGNCAIGTCNNGSTAIGESCAIGNSFAIPQTVAEFTLLETGNDSYDIQIINGVTVPTTMKPTNTTYGPYDDPYYNGEAGAMESQITPVRSLYSSSWNFIPSTYGSTNSLTYYNYVTGISTNTDSCTTNNDCALGEVCGYAYNSIFNPNPTYTRTCGIRLAYLTAETVWKGNPDTVGVSNVGAFDFYSVLDNGPQSSVLPYPNVNQYPLYQFYNCPTPPMNSGYQSVTTYPIACGCTNWDGVASPTSKCMGTGKSVTSYGSSTQGIGFNSAWINQVFPRIEWLKQACPTCYTYEYDDPSSSFNGYVAASSSNPANGTNYTITFCPNGKGINN